MNQRTDWAAPAVAGIPASSHELGGFFTDLASGNGAVAMDRLVADGFSGGLKIAGAVRNPAPDVPAVNTVDGGGKGPNWGLYAGIGAAVVAVGLYFAWGR